MSGAVATAPARVLAGHVHVIVQIVILAMIAAFLGLRLYAVLGRRTEQNDEPMRRRVEQPDPSAPPSPSTRGLAPEARTPRVPEVSAPAPRPVPLAPEARQFETAAEAGVRAIVTADRRFDVNQFLAGARNAYGMVLAAFWRGDKAELANLCDGAVLDGFAAAIDARVAAGETVEARLIRIEEARIVAAECTGSIARVTVRFVADIASVTRNANGVVVAGSLNDAIVSRDVWTFVRNLTARDPDWMLDETDAG